ncbi:MAG: hypothetical protein ACW98I_13935 [Candidatus Hodarchaeales archaeon]|jgi:hypothetical protein
MVWNGTGNYFWHKITDREPGDAITYNFTVIDNAGNIASIPLTLLIVSDTITPIFVVDPTVNEIQIDHITTEITFRTVVQDPFGYISYVLLEYAILEESGWTNFSSLLDLIGSEYSYKALFVPNSTLQFRMTVVDTMLNNVTSHYSNIRLADFDPASFDVAEYGIEPSSESGKVTIWASIDDPFDDHDTNVSISITDVTIGLLILNNVHMIPEGKNYTYLFPVEYLHNYSFTLTLVDLGVHYGYYPADVLLLTNTHMGDLWTPDILVAGYESLNNTELLFWVNCSDWGSGIINVTLYYSFEEGRGGQLGDGFENIIMVSNGSHYTAQLSLKGSGKLFWNIAAYDQNGYSIHQGPEQGVPILGSDGGNGIPIETLIAALIGSLIVLGIVSSVTLSIKGRRRRSKQYKESLQDKLSFLSNTYTILVASSAGVPILTTTNVLYQAENSMNGALSGLSVGIDSFLASFQSDFMNQVYTSEDNRTPYQAKDIKVSLIEQDEVQILILGSETYRIFVFLREIPSEFLRTAFVKIIRELEQKLRLGELGIIDEAILGPQVRKIISIHLPINLLQPFKIDLQKIKYYDQILTKGVEDSPISREALDALKILTITTFSRQSSTKKTKSLLKLCDEYIVMSTQRFTGVTFYTSARAIISKFIKFPIELEYELFWTAVDEKVKILVPQNGS